MQNAQPPEQVQAAFDDAVKAEPGSRAPEERGPGLRQRRRPARARHGVAAAAGSRRLQRERHRARRGRCQPLPPDPGRVRQGAGGHPRAPLSRHDAVGARQLEQGADRPERAATTCSTCRSTTAQAGAGRRGRGRGERRRGPRPAPPEAARDARPEPQPRVAAQPRRGATADEGRRRRILALLVAALLVLSQSLYTVDQRQNAIKFQLGEFIDAKTEAGLYFKVPLLQNVALLRHAHPACSMTAEPGPHHHLGEEAAQGRLHRQVAHHRRAQVLPERHRRREAGDDAGWRRRSAPILGAGDQQAHDARGDLDRARQDHEDDAPEGRRGRQDDRRRGRRRAAEARRAARGSARAGLPAHGIRAQARRQRAALARRGRIGEDPRRRRPAARSDPRRGLQQAQKIKGEGDAKAAAIYARAYGQNPEFYSFYRSLEAYKATFRSKSDVWCSIRAPSSSST